MKLGVPQGAFYWILYGKWNRYGVGGGLWSAGNQGHPSQKATSVFVPACCPGQRGIKCWHTWSEFPFQSGCLLARPFQPESSLCMLQLPQLWKCLQQQWRSKLSTSNKSVNRRGEKPAQRPQKPFGPTYRDVSVSGRACVGLRVLWQRWYVWKWRAVAEYGAGLRRAVNGTLVLCLIICHGRLMILSDPTVPFNFVFIKSALDF